MRPDVSATAREALWQWLVERGLAGDDAPAHAEGPVWYLALMLGIAAWFAGLLLMLVTVLVWNVSGTESLLPLALLWGVPGLLLLRVDGLGVFPGQLGLALLVAAECAAVAALGSALDRAEPTLFASVLLFACVTAVAARPAAQVLNALAACIAWVMALRWSLLGEPWLYWRAEAAPSLPAALLVWLLCWGPLLLAAVWIARSEARWMASAWSGVLRSALIGVVLALAFATPLSDPLGGLVLRESDGSRDWLALWPLLSLLAAGVAAAVAFQQRARLLVGACVLGLLVHVASFYYALGVSLLAKSMVMVGMGLALLGLAYALREADA